MLSVNKLNHLTFKHNYNKLERNRFISIIPLKQSIYYSVGDKLSIFLDLKKVIIFPYVKILKITELAIKYIPFVILQRDIECITFKPKNIKQYCKLKRFKNGNENVSILLLEKIKISENYDKIN